MFPHQIDLALEILLDEFGATATPLLKSLNEAYELSIPNLTELFSHGRTAVVIDTSGSMHGSYNVIKVGDKNINKSPIEKAALIGATLAKGIGGDLYQFSSTCEMIKYNPNDSFNTIKKTALSQEGRVGHGTSFSSIFDTIRGTKYDRIFIISDLQGGDRIISNSSYTQYVSKYGMPYIYTIDLQGYGTTMFKKDKKLIQIFGYGSDIYEYCRTSEIDPQVVIKAIEAIEI